VSGGCDDRWAWMGRGACVGVGIDLFMSEKACDVRRAKLICSRCEVRDPCVEFALDDPSVEGTCGGMTATERRRIRRAPAR